MASIITSELIKVLEKAVNHASHIRADEDSALTPDAGALVRDVGKDKATMALQLRRSMGSLNFAENLAKCICNSKHRRRLNK
jgi:hypothetical protein